MKIFIQIILFFILSTLLLPAQSWKPVKSLSGGSISLLSANTEGDILCTSYNRIFKSTDEGNNWNEYFINEFISQPVTAFGFLKDDLWLIGAGEIIYRSTNSGLSWELIDSLTLDNVRCFVHLRGDSILAGTDRNLLLSTDNGIIWTVVPNWKIGATNIFKTDTRLFITSFTALYESDYNLGQWDKTPFGKDGPQINGLIFHRGNSIFAYVPESGKIFYTTNGGNLWLFSSLMIPWTITGNPYVALDGSHYIITRQRGLCKSTNSGFYWERADSGLLTIPLKSLFLETPDALYFSDGLRIYKSTDNGSRWVQCNNGINALNINTFLFSGENIYIATNTNGFYKSIDRGETWESTGFALDSMDVISICTEPQSGIFAGTHFDGVMHSTDYGSSFESQSNGITHSQNPNIYSLACDSTGKFKRIYAGTLGLYYFSSYQWEKFSYDSLYLTDVYDIKFGRNSGEIYLATDNGIFYSYDYGENWYNISLRNKLITNILINSLDMYAGTWSSDGVLYSPDDGYTWEIRNNGLPDFSMIKGMVQDSMGTIFAATLNSGIYATNDKGMNWQPVNSGLPTGSMGSIGISPKGTLYAATAGWGLYYYDTSLEIKDDNYIYNNIFISPNPASDFIEITYPVGVSPAGGGQRVDIRIFDILGIEQFTLTPALSLKGEVVRIDITGLAPGVYFVRVRDAVRKFVKL